NADGSFKDWSETLALLTQSIDLYRNHMGEAATFDLLSAMGGKNAPTSLLALTSKGTEGMITLVDGTVRARTELDDYVLKMAQSTGASEKAAAITDTFAGRMVSLKSSIQGVVIRALKPLLQALKPALEGAIKFVNFIA